MSLKSILRTVFLPSREPQPFASQATFYEALRYLLTGAIGFFGFSTPVIWYLVENLHIYYLVASGVGYLSVGVLEWLLRRYLVFR